MPILALGVKCVGRQGSGAVWYVEDILDLVWKWVFRLFAGFLPPKSLDWRLVFNLVRRYLCLRL